MLARREMFGATTHSLNKCRRIDHSGTRIELQITLVTTRLVFADTFVATSAVASETWLTNATLMFWLVGAKRPPARFGLVALLRCVWAALVRRVAVLLMMFALLSRADEASRTFAMCVFECDWTTIRANVGAATSAMQSDTFTIATVVVRTTLETVVLSAMTSWSSSTGKRFLIVAVRQAKYVTVHVTRATETVVLWQRCCCRCAVARVRTFGLRTTSARQLQVIIQALKRVANGHTCASNRRRDILGDTRRCLVGTNALAKRAKVCSCFAHHCTIFTCCNITTRFVHEKRRAAVAIHGLPVVKTYSTSDTATKLFRGRRRRRHRRYRCRSWRRRHWRRCRCRSWRRRYWRWCR